MNKFLVCCLLIGIFISACTSGAKKDKKLAQVGSEILYESEFKANFSETEWKNLSTENRKKYLEQWVNITLMAQEADQEGLNKDALVKQRMEYAAKKIKSNALIAGRLAELQISEDDLFNYYRLHLGEFQKPVMEYKVQRIFVKDQSRLERIKNEILAGLAFDAAVSIFSQESLRESGGYMGFVNSTGADSLIWNAAKNLQKGELGTVETKGGWFIIRYYEERNSNEEAGFDLYKEEIRKRILQERRQAVYEDLLLELKQKNSDIYYY